jgi:hypothetical protein
VRSSKPLPIGILDHEYTARLDDLAGQVECLAKAAVQPGYDRSYELVEGKFELCRIEKATEFNSAIPELVKYFQPIVSSELGQGVSLFKDKINRKAPGGAGYAPHRDIDAYFSLTCCLTAVIGLSDGGPLSGPILIQSPKGIQRMLLGLGEYFLLPGTSVHWSSKNSTGLARTLLLLTFAPVSDPYLRMNYYRDRDSLISAVSGSAMSPTNDFRGQLLQPGAHPIVQLTDPRSYSYSSSARDQSE